MKEFKDICFAHTVDIIKKEKKISVKFLSFSFQFTISIITLETEITEVVYLVVIVPMR